MKRKSDFNKVYLSLIEEERMKTRVLQRFSYIITEADEQNAQKIADATKEAGEKSSWFSWDNVKSVGKALWDGAKKLPGAGDIFCALSGEPEKGPLVHAIMSTYTDVKNAFSPEEVKKFREEAKKDEFLKALIEKNKVDMNNDEEVARWMMILRDQASAAKKAAEDEKYAKSLAKKISDKQTSDNAAKDNLVNFKKTCPAAYKAIRKSGIPDGKYKIILSI